MRLSYIGIQNCWVPIEKCQTDISIKKGSASTSIKRTHFAIVWKSIDHKIQGLPLKQDIIDFYLQKQ